DRTLGYPPSLLLPLRAGSRGILPESVVEFNEAGGAGPGRSCAGPRPPGRPGNPPRPPMATTSRLTAVAGDGGGTASRPPRGSRGSDSPRPPSWAPPVVSGRS